MQITIITIFILLIYSILILLFLFGWQKMPIYFPPKTKKEQTSFISVVVCARNEEKQIANMLLAMTKQTYSNFELIIVNDHSTDDTVNIASLFMVENPAFRIVHAEGFGKKNALKEGIAASMGEIIVQTDADCVPPPQWLDTIAGYLSENECDLLIGPVAITPSSSFGDMQAIEFMSLVASGAGAATIGSPIMCNGANLIYTPSLWKEAESSLNGEFLSGDDMFLLMFAKKMKKKIAFLKAPGAIVSTRPAESVANFIRQRQRWVSKSPGYRDFFVIFTALSVFSVVLLFWALLFLGEFWLLLFVFIVKGVVDFLFLFNTASFFHLRKCLKWFIPVSVIYPVYVLGCGITGLFGKDKW